MYPSHPFVNTYANKWLADVQFHPELKSTVENPHPLFVAFVKASIG
jgi:CTP synthase